MIGKTLSHYEVTEKLGEGGTGVVHKACDNHPDRFTAGNNTPREWQPAPAWPLEEIRSGRQES